ncbi:Organic cation transporter protein like [Argiope bruennichi]|uniref:Organic cation transporter protein like n=1 Tax=Argiope bruennichi TaxID=94029 RepID=A0A8T0ESB6_ARGBR|nr:Organic cation transporter protein like [Argiope bruennichi]
MVKQDAEKTAPSSKKPEKQEDLMDLAGGEGPWQRWIFVVAVLCALPDASHNMAMTFFAPSLDHWCSRPPEVNVTMKEWKAVAIPPDDAHCSRYKFLNDTGFQMDPFKNATSRETLQCDSWEYDDSIYKSTVLSQWNLVCDREWLISLSKSVFIAGYFLSATVFGYLADKFGRRPIIAMCNAIALVSAISSLFSTSFLMFAITRFFIAAGVTGLDNITYVLMMEIISPKYRSAYGIGVNFGWILGYLCLPGIAWLLRDWIYMQIALTLPFIFHLSSWWFLPESPRWLLAHGKTEEAAKIIYKAAKRNGFDLSDVKLNEVISHTTKIHAAESEKVNVLQLFKPGLWQKTVIILYLWFTNAFMYYGISYNTNELAGDPFLNFALYGVIEIPAYAITLFVIQSKGRRMPQAMSCIAAGLSCWMIYPIPKDPWWMSEMVSLFGKFCITSSFSILYVFATELFPTTVRTVGLGAAQVCARSGAIIAPFVREMGKASHPIVPQLIFGFLAVTAGFLSLLLPETKNCSIPDTIKEAALISRKKSTKNDVENIVVLKELKSRNESID